MQLPIAAVIHRGNGEGDELLKRILAERQQHGLIIRGLITAQGKDPTGQTPMQLQDLHTQESFIISQCLGKAGQGCTLDLAGLNQAGQVLRAALNEQPDLVFINRFGHGESLGLGLIEEFSALIGAGIPVLTLVSEKYLASWQAFSGGLATELPLHDSAINQWIDKTLTERKIHD